jgi:uncharacterized phage infection (PIP) family protein YhgE
MKERLRYLLFGALTGVIIGLLICLVMLFFGNVGYAIWVLFDCALLFGIVGTLFGRKSESFFRGLFGWLAILP